MIPQHCESKNPFQDSYLCEEEERRQETQRFFKIQQRPLRVKLAIHGFPLLLHLVIHFMRLYFGILSYSSYVPSYSNFSLHFASIYKHFIPRNVNGAWNFNICQMSLESDVG